MTSFVTWLLAAEVIGIAYLPLTLWLLRRLPDRGYSFAKILGLLVVTYLTWIVGNVAPIVGSAAVPGAITLAGGVAGWLLYGRKSVSSLGKIRDLVLIEEAIFIGALAVWSLLRVYVFDSSIAHTEQFMDLTFLQGSMRSNSYPPFDAWMSGHAINYYYMGYLMIATLAKLSGVTPTVAYNLALSTLFAFTVVGAYSLGYALVRRRVWAALFPFFVALVGNWHALLWQVPHSGCAGSTGPDFWTWLWQSTRVVDNHFSLADWDCGAAAHSASNTINEYPLFSFVLGDLHPHVMALPVVLLTLGLACSLLFAERPADLRITRRTVLHVLCVAISVGSLFTINSWDYPTYLAVVLACIAANAYIRDGTARWWRGPALVCAAVVALSLLLFLPFYAHFTSLARGLGNVNASTDPFEFVQVFGLFLLAPTLLIGSLYLLLRPAEESTQETQEEAPPPREVVEVGRESGAISLNGIIIALAFCASGIISHKIVLFALLGLAYWGGVTVYRVLNSEKPNRSDVVALLLVIAGCLVLAGTEVVYLRDVFDGSGSYRMNTVFKFYYQGWVLLGLGAAYAVFRVWGVLRRLFERRLAAAALIVLTLGSAGSAIYTRYIPSYAVGTSELHTLDGMAYVQRDHPADFGVIQWLDTHAQAGSVELESTKDEYSYFSRISTFSGLPTVIGWAGHENQWRPNDPNIGVRVNDVRTLYTTTNLVLTKALLRKYNVRYVVVGDSERQAYGTTQGLDKFGRFMRVAYRAGGTTLFQW